MIFPKTVLKAADNSGAKYVRCLRILKTKSASGKKNYATVGDIILVSVRLSKSIKKIRKGNVFKAIVVRTKKLIRRNENMVLFDDNAVVLLDSKKMLPIGTRVFGPISREIQYQKMFKILSCAPIVI